MLPTKIIFFFHITSQSVLSKIGHDGAMVEFGGGFTDYRHHTTLAKRILYGGP